MINLAKKQQKLLQNFYVDDLLKSTKGAEEAVSLIKNVVQMCAAGGFRLTKFISNILMCYLQYLKKTEKLV